MFNREAVRDLVLQDLDMMNPQEAQSILRHPARLEQLVDEKMSRLQSRRDLALKRGASEAQAEELALDGIQSYDPEEERAWQESQEVFGGRVVDEDVPG